MSAGPPLDFIPPHFDGRVLAVARWLLPLWLRRQSRIGAITVDHPERLAAAFERFETGRSRLMLAFRHPSIDDPAVMAHLLWSKGHHAQFLYDRGIPLWAGKAIGWSFSRLGGVSIQRGKLDLPALRTSRDLLVNGPYPFAAAPEGATNGHNERVSSLEPGVAQLAFWTADELARGGRPERMEILPIGLQYFYEAPVWGAIDSLLSQLERNAGLPTAAEADATTAGQAESSLDPERLYARLLRLGESMLVLLENFYRQSYRQPLGSGRGKQATATGASADGDLPIAQRVQNLMDTALGVVERSFGLEPRGDLVERCRRLEQAGWERMYPTATSDTAPPPSPLRQGLADRLAEETERRMWHMQMVEAFVAVNGSYVREQPSQERFADTLLLLWDTDCRIRGGDPGKRPRLGKRRVRISIDNPINLQERMEAYRLDRRQAVAALTRDLQAQLEALILPTATGT